MTLYGMKTSDAYLQFFEAGAMSDRRNISVLPQSVGVCTTLEGRSPM